MTRPAYDPAATYQFKTTAFPFTEAESVPATMTEAAVAAAGIATAAKQLLIKDKTDLIPADPATVTNQDEIIAGIATIVITCVNAAAVEAILDARGITTDNIPLTEQPLTSVQTQSAAAAAIAAAEPIDANVTQVAGVSFAEGVREALGMADADMDDQLDAILAASSPQGGVYTQTVTVKTTGGVAIPNATVAIYSGSVLIDTKTTNASGVAQPTCDANPAYTLRVTATGYASYLAALAVTGDATLADIVLSSSETTITPSADQAKTTAYWIVYGADTMPVGEDDVTATIWIIKMPSDHGAAYVDNPVQTISTTTNGILSATLFKGATYQIALSDGREWVVEVPLKAGTTYKMPPIRVAEA